MGKFKFKDKHLDYKTRGDKIEIKLMDDAFQVFYKRSVSVNNKKELAQMMNDLRGYGIDLRKVMVEVDWF